jgi:hypothetical protein
MTYLLGVLAISIPLEKFDQSKLENLLRNIPEAYVQTQPVENFERRFYSFPDISFGFNISCSADHFEGAQIPSAKRCTFLVDEREMQGRKYRLEILDPEVVSAFRIALGGKKIWSTELVDKKFRYAFECDQNRCLISGIAK